MDISSRFGPIRIQDEQVLQFPSGLMGLENCRTWVLLEDQQSPAVAWLQSLDRPELAMGVVSPRRFVPGYQLRVARRELAPLELDDFRSARVLAIVGRTSRGLSLNLKAPLVINPAARLGRQVIANGEMPIHYELGSLAGAMKKTA